MVPRDDALTLNRSSSCCGWVARRPACFAINSRLRSQVLRIVPTSETRPTRGATAWYRASHRAHRSAVRSRCQLSPFRKISVAVGPSTFSCRSRRKDGDRKSTRLNSSHEWISYAVFCLKKKKEVYYNITSSDV